MKTPDEIKIWLETEIAVHYHLPNPEPRLTPKEFMFLEKMRGETLAYIQKLESHIEELVADNNRLDEIRAKLERERDAMSYDMHQLQGALCAYCENLYRPAGSKKVSCKVFGDGYGAEDNSPLICGKFKWRGICEENEKER